MTIRRAWIVLLVLGIALLLVGGLLPSYRLGGRYDFRYAWGFDLFPTSRHLLLAGRWLLVLAVPALAALAAIRSSPLASGLLLASVLLVTIEALDRLGFLVGQQDGGFAVRSGTHVTVAGCALVAVGATGALLARRSGRLASTAAPSALAAAVDRPAEIREDPPGT